MRPFSGGPGRYPSCPSGEIGRHKGLKQFEPSSGNARSDARQIRRKPSMPRIGANAEPSPATMGRCREQTAGTYGRKAMVKACSRPRTAHALAAKVEVVRKSLAARRAGSIPASGTNQRPPLLRRPEHPPAQCLAQTVLPTFRRPARGSSMALKPDAAALCACIKPQCIDRPTPSRQDQSLANDVPRLRSCRRGQTGRRRRIHAGLIARFLSSKTESSMWPLKKLEDFHSSLRPTPIIINQTIELTDAP